MARPKVLRDSWALEMVVATLEKRYKLFSTGNCETTHSGYTKIV